MSILMSLRAKPGTATEIHHNASVMLFFLNIVCMINIFFVYFQHVRHILFIKHSRAQIKGTSLGQEPITFWRSLTWTRERLCSRAYMRNSWDTTWKRLTTTNQRKPRLCERCSFIHRFIFISLWMGSSSVSV